MQLGMIGLGRMGANMVRRLMDGGHDCVVHDVTEEAIAELEADGASGAAHARGVRRRRSTAPRHVWIMVPGRVRRRDRRPPGAAARRRRHDHRRRQLLVPRRRRPQRSAASRSRHPLPRRRHERRHPRPRARLLPDGRRRRRRGRPAWRRSSTRSRPASTPPTRTPGRTGDPATAERGWLHCGPSGAGHFVKMVHNGIEYGLMAAYAEGLNVLAKAGIGSATHAADAETAPLDRRPSTTSTTSTWRRSPRSGAGAASSPAGCSTSPPRRCTTIPSSTQYAGHVSDSGEGRWTIHAAIDEGVPVARAVGRAVRAVQLARTRRRRRQGAVGDAGRLRRPRRAKESTR